MAKRKASTWNIDLQTALIPLYLVSKLCCLNAFTYLPLKKCTVPRNINSIGDCSAKRTTDGKTLAFSIVGLLHAVGCSFAYASYHILSSLSQSSKLTDSNLVRVAIDLKNQYVGCILVLVLVTVSLVRQPTLDRLIRVLVRVDQLLPTMTGAVVQPNLKHTGVNNAVWWRNVLLMLVFGVGVKATLEITNCLMYIRDSGSPFSSNCLLLCIVPQTLCVISELQFVAYALLIRDRLRLLNRWLLQLQPQLACGSESAFESVHHLVHIHGKLANAIGLLNRCFGVQNAILLLFQFVTLVELGYNTSMMSVRYAEAESQQGDSTEDFLETVYWIVWFVMEMFALCYFSHATVEEVQELEGAHLCSVAVEPHTYFDTLWNVLVLALLVSVFLIVKIPLDCQVVCTGNRRGFSDKALG
uniref:Gustatory receptor n=1 Tax=Anopheles maculatus TaxID=74869 RepID=A0A182SED1_9DIPT